MTEIPEHLLQRSRERRAALGLGGGDAGGDAPAAAAAATPSAEVTPAPAAAAAAAPVAPVAKEPEPVPHYVEAAQKRHRIPIWAFPVLAGLVFWAPIYIGTLGLPEQGGPLQAGGEIYVSAQCGACHGAGGGGGVGRQLAGGEVLLTFPEWQDHYNYVLLGTAGYEGQVIGDPNRPGGAHVAGEFGTMPPFADTLSTLEILEVTLYERVTHGEADMESEDILSLLEAIEAVEGGAELDLAAGE